MFRDVNPTTQTSLTAASRHRYEAACELFDKTSSLFPTNSNCVGRTSFENGFVSFSPPIRTRSLVSGSSSFLRGTRPVFIASASITNAARVRNRARPRIPSMAVESLAVDVAARNIPLAITLSTLAGLSTGIGGILMVMQNNLDFRRLGLWQGCAAGFMLAVTFLDLIPEVIHDSTSQGALTTAFLWFVAGAGFFLLLKCFVPEPDFDTLISARGDGQEQDGSDEVRSRSVSEYREVLWSGFTVAIALALHNFPEGVAVCFGSLRGVSFGATLALAVALHNIPEGAAVALPVYFATRDKAYAVKVAFLSGLAEPAGVLVFIFLTRSAINFTFVGFMLSAVAGIMTVLSVTELLPLAVKHAGWVGATLTSVGSFLAMGILLGVIHSLDLGI
mmetsp:Transcript_18664/g.39244  ORF Transcript_18664/g.39244 Transcript_18664/m.39244 type:complete len:390 (-) Transcript_18664:848-2017(-)